MLSRASRILTHIVAALFTLTGAALFVLPDQLAPVFAWQVTPFMTMTIGGWCLGNAWLAWITARRWSWELVYTSLIYLWLFGLIETAVLFVFRAKLRLVHPIAWAYVGTLGVNVIAAVAGVIDWLRLRPALEAGGPAREKSMKYATIAFVIFVGFLALYGLMAPLGAAGTNRGVFPEMMSVFTLRSFGAFYLSLAVAAIPLITDERLAPSLHHGFASFGLIVAITVAAFAYFKLFDLAARPGGLVYFSAYLLVGIPLMFVFRRFGTGAQPAARA